MSAVVASARPSQALRVRRESQRPSVAKAPARPNIMESLNFAPKEEVKRYVTTQQDILAKFKGFPPSLRVSLHQNHFRLNDSQETLSYASPMRELLQHIREKTVPHNMIETFYDINVPFYDHCLIVEVHDFRSAGIKPKVDANSAADGINTTAFSIHNHNEYITPSPHVPYPASLPVAKSKLGEGQSKVLETQEDKDAGKENMPAPGQPISQKQPPKSKVTTVVLFPTTQSHLTDMQLLAATPMPDAATYRRNQATGRTVGNPPTPLTAVPPTPTFASGRSPKRQRMMIDDSNVHEVEEAILDTQCPKLYLEPTGSLAESDAIMRAMTHPNNNNPAPARNPRKRTTAELAADEAEAADMQRFMLAGDEFQASKTAAASGGDEGQHAVRAGANQQTFSRFKTLAAIKTNREEEERRKKEEEARQAQIKRQAQMEAEAQKRREMETNRQAEQNAAMLQQRQEMMRQQQQQQAQAQALQQASQNSQAQQMANMPVQAHQTPLSATQAQYTSPIVRQHTPMAAAASPLVSAHATHPMGGTPMVATSSNHNAGSPARPPSVVQNQQAAMARSVSQQQNQGMSRTGTPQMMQGTPIMGAAGPARNISSTPTPRMNQGSPPGPMQGSTPIMIQTPQPGQGMTPEQMQMAQQNRLQQQMRQRQMMQQQGMSPGNTQQMQQLAMQRARMQIQTNGVPQGQDAQHYQQLIANRIYQQLQQQSQQAQMNSASPQGMPHGGVPNQGAGTNLANMNLQQLRAQYMQRKQALLAQFGTNVPQQHLAPMRQLEMAIAQREQAQQQQQQLAQGGQMQMNQTMQNQMAMQGNGSNSPANVQMQQYQQMLQQQRAQQQRQQQMMAMRQQQQQALQNGQMNMMGNNMQGMNMNMGNMQGMQNTNMVNMGQGMGMGNMGMQGMNMGNGQAPNAQQMHQQMLMMRQAQQRAAQMAGQQGQGGGDSLNWSGV